MFPARDGGGGDHGRDAYWYTQRLQTLAHARQWTRATELLRTMHAERVPDAQAAYRVVLDGCGAAGAVASAVAVLALAKRHGVPLDSRTYTSAVRALARNARKGDAWDRAWALFEEMRAKGIPPTTYTYNALLFAVADLARGDLAAVLVETAAEDEVDLDSTSYDLLIRTSLRAADANGALIYFRDAVRARQVLRRRLDPRAPSLMHHPPGSPGLCCCCCCCCCAHPCRRRLASRPFSSCWTCASAA